VTENKLGEERSKYLDFVCIKVNDNVLELQVTRDCLCASLHKSVGIEHNRWYRSVRTTVYV
jgi:hypothetical protein